AVLDCTEVAEEVHLLLAGLHEGPAEGAAGSRRRLVAGGPLADRDVPGQGGGPGAAVGAVLVLALALEGRPLLGELHRALLGMERELISAHEPGRRDARAFAEGPGDLELLVGRILARPPALELLAIEAHLVLAVLRRGLVPVPLAVLALHRERDP